MNRNNQGNIPFFTLLFGILLIIVVSLSTHYFFYKFSIPKLLNQNNPLSSPSTKSSEDSNNQNVNYKSKTLKVSFAIPPGYKNEEQFNLIKLTREDSSIIISKDGSQSYNVEDHLEELIQKNKMTISDKKNIEIDSKKAIHVNLISDTSTEKVYFVYFEDFIYTFSTKYEKSYTDLDIIISSVRFES